MKVKKTIKKEVEKTYCDICCCKLFIPIEIKELYFKTLSNYYLSSSCSNYYTAEFIAKVFKPKKYICTNCFNKAINKALKELYK